MYETRKGSGEFGEDFVSLFKHCSLEKSVIKNIHHPYMADKETKI